MNHRNGQAGEAVFPRDRLDAPRGADRISGPHVGDDADLVGRAMAQNGRHAFIQQRVIAAFRIRQPRALGKRNGALGQAFENQVVQPAEAGQFHRGFNAVPGKAGAGSDSNGFGNTDHIGNSPKRTLAAVMTREAANNSGAVNLWCLPSSTPASPATRKVAGVKGLTGKPVVI